MWVALCGVTLVGAAPARCCAATRVRRTAPPARIPSWTLALFALAAALARARSRSATSSAAIRASRSCTSWSASSSSRRARRATARCSSASPASCSITPFFYSQSLFAALAALPAVLLLGGDARRARRGADDGDAPSRWRARAARRAVDDAAGHAARGAALRAVSAARRPLWGLAAGLLRAQSGLSDSHGAGRDQRAVAVRRRRVSRRLRRPVRRPSQRYWRGPVLTRFDGRDVDRRHARASAARSARRARTARSRYTVTLEPNNAVAVRARHARGAAAIAPAATRDAAAAGARITRDQQLAHRARPSRRRCATRSVRCCARRIPSTQQRARARRNLRLGARQPAHASSSRASCAPRIPIRSRLHRRRARASSTTRISSTRWRRRCCATNPVDMFLFDAPARILRALRERLRRAAARCRHSRARRHRLSGRRDESARRLHDRAPIRRACVGRSAASTATGSASIPPPRWRRRASRSGWAARCPPANACRFFARLDVIWLKNVQLAWDAFNHDWRRNVVGFNRDRQRYAVARMAARRLRAVAGWRGRRS